MRVEKFVKELTALLFENLKIKESTNIHFYHMPVKIIYTDIHERDLFFTC